MLNNFKHTALLSIILTNLIPVYGVIFWNWTPFYVFWLFWIETLIVAFFNVAKILLSKGEVKNRYNIPSLSIIGLLFRNSKSKWYIAFKYIVARIFIFIFYSIFIVVFIGFLGSSKDNSVKNVEVMALASHTFNYALMAFIANQIVQFYRDYYLNEHYKNTSPSDFNSLFDGRQIVVHISVVLGAVLSQLVFKGEKQSMLSMIAVVLVFVTIKTFYDIFKYKSESISD